MVMKIYTSVWLVVIAAAAGFYFTGNFDDVTLAVLGFIVATLFFGFFVAVLPWLMDKHYAWKY